MHWFVLRECRCGVDRVGVSARCVRQWRARRQTDERRRSAAPTCAVHSHSRAHATCTPQTNPLSLSLPIAAAFPVAHRRSEAKRTKNGVAVRADRWLRVAMRWVVVMATRSEPTDCIPNQRTHRAPPQHPHFTSSQWRLFFFVGSFSFRDGMENARDCSAKKGKAKRLTGNGETRPTEQRSGHDWPEGRVVEWVWGGSDSGSACCCVSGDRQPTTVKPTRAALTGRFRLCSCSLRSVHADTPRTHPSAAHSASHSHLSHAPQGSSASGGGPGQSVRSVQTRSRSRSQTSRR